MSAFVDTNILVRHLTNDPPDMAKRATAFLGSTDELLLLRTIEVYDVHRIDFADAYLVANAEAAGVTEIVSFDRSISRVASTNRIEP
ncbi:MAG: type II toxin-antitoxin system VapC family toxin [Actinobacteria bacterium]|nr:type II toxin-antitoxin system VapC family toxin [Actinomycetota bacterium]